MITIYGECMQYTIFSFGMKWEFFSRVCVWKNRAFNQAQEKSRLHWITFCQIHTLRKRYRINCTYVPYFKLNCITMASPPKTSSLLLSFNAYRGNNHFHLKYYSYCVCMCVCLYILWFCFSFRCSSILRSTYQQYEQFISIIKIRNTKYRQRKCLLHVLRCIFGVWLWPFARHQPPIFNMPANPILLSVAHI